MDGFDWGGRKTKGRKGQRYESEPEPAPEPEQEPEPEPDVIATMPGGEAVNVLVASLKL